MNGGQYMGFKNNLSPANAFEDLQSPGGLPSNSQKQSKQIPYKNEGAQPLP